MALLENITRRRNFFLKFLQNKCISDENADTDTNANKKANPNT